MVRIAIFIDSKYRDVFPAVVLEKELLKRTKNTDILLVSFDLWQEVMNFYKPDVVVLNHALGERNKEIIRRARYSIILPTEGRPNTLAQKQWYVEDQDGIPDLFLSWTDSMSEMFRKTEAVTTGNVRFDLYYDYPQLINTREEARAKLGLRDDELVFGLFTSFPQAKFAMSNTEFNAADWKDLGLTKVEGMSDPGAYAKQEESDRLRFLSMAALIPLVTGGKLLVKPHPMEDVLLLQHWSQEQSGKFVSQDNIANVIAACDYVVNRRGCMTTADSLLMGVPVHEIGDGGQGDAFENKSFSSHPEHFLYALQNRSTFGFLEHSEGKDIVSLCGGLGGGAAIIAAREISKRISGLGDTSEHVSAEERESLERLIMTHSAKNVIPHPLALPIGKVPTKGYIDSWRRKVE